MRKASALAQNAVSKLDLEICPRYQKAFSALCGRISSFFELTANKEESTLQSVTSGIGRTRNTHGQARIVSINAVSDQPAEELLRLAASLDQASKHIVAQAIVEAARDRGLELAIPHDIVETPGEGAEGCVDGHHVIVAGLRFVTANLAETSLSIYEYRCAIGFARCGFSFSLSLPRSAISRHWDETTPWTKGGARVTADALDALGRTEEAKALRKPYGVTSSDDRKPS